VVLGVVAVAVAYALRLAHAGETLRRSQVARLALAGLALGLLKLPIPLVAGAIALIVWPLLGRGGARRWSLAALALPCIAAAVWWNLTIDAYFLPYRNTVFAARLRKRISQHGQIHYIVTHVIDMPALLWNTLSSGQLFQVSQLAGSYGTHSFRGWIAAIWIVGAVTLALTFGERDGPTRRVRSGLAALLAVCLIVTALALYLTWNAVGASSIEGIQGRYFAPLLVLFVPLLVGVVRVPWRLPEWVGPAAAMTISGAGAVVLFESTAWTYYHQPLWQVVPRVVNVLF
jgi:uncharacterized membrane protein